MIKNRLFSLLVLLSLAAVLWLMCGKSGSEVLAVVGDYEITTDEFNEFYKIRYSFPTAQDEFTAKRQALDSAIITRLLIQAAYEKNIDKLEELTRVVLANKDKFLIDVLLQRKIADKAEPSEAEIKEFYNHLEYKINASHILVNDPDTAEMLFEKIKNGESFEKLAYHYSIDQSAKKNKGNLGYFTWGAMVDEFQEAAFSMQPGELSLPVKSRFGYHIIKVVDKLPNEQRTDFKSMKSSLIEVVKRYKSDKLAEQYFDDIKVRYVVSIDTAACDYLLHKRKMIYPPTLLKTLPKNDFDLEQLDRNEKELVLATWDGGQMTVMDYLTLANRNVPRDIRPDFDNYDSLAAIIFRLKLSDIMVVEAHREGIDNDPEFLRKLKLFKELAMAEIMRDDSIPMPPPLDEAMVRQYYDENAEEFTVPAKVHIHEILISDELKARKLKRELNSLEEFKKAASKLTERVGKRIGGGDLGYIQEKWFPEVFPEAWKTPVGGIGGPILTNGKYTLFYVVDKIEKQLKDYLGVKREIVQKLVNKQKEEAFEMWVEQRKKTTPIAVYEDAIWSTIDMDKYAAIDTTSSSN